MTHEPPTIAQTVFILLVGNELLSGKVQDLNGYRAISSLRQAGLELLGMEVVPDEVPRIVSAVRRILAELKPDVLITSGGVGPTHDDVTVGAVAEALGLSRVRHAKFAELIRGHYKERTNADALSMADVPQGAELIFEDGSFFPLIRTGRVYCLPGDPKYFDAKLAVLCRRVAGAPRFVQWRLVALCGEVEIADGMRRVQAEFPDVPIGSYPIYDTARGLWTLITVDTRDAAKAERVVEQLKAIVPPGRLEKVERTA